MEFSQLAVLLVVAGVFGIIAKSLKQPLLVGYLLAGLVLGYFGIVGDIEVFSGLGQIGVTLLLFLLGLEMNIRELPTIGKTALLTGIGQIVFTSAIGFLIATALGFPVLPSVYIAIALTFSSTIIMVKLLSEKKDLASLYGRIAIGFLLVQDFVAILILMFLAGLGRGDLSPGLYGLTALKALVLFFLVWTLSKKVLPNIFDKYIASSHELLFIVSIAWALGVAALVAGPLGFTLEIGGFLAGLALSNLPEHLQIASRTRPLRDFFLTIFFLLLGTKLVVGGISGIFLPALVFSLFVFIGNPAIVMAIMGFLGYRKRTSFLAGLTVAQISEFSFILMAMGVSLGHVENTHVALVVLVGVFTMTTSTYAILGADGLFRRVKNYLSVFERAKPREAALLEERFISDHVVLVGAGRTGGALTSFFKKRQWPFLIVDFNPRVFSRLSADKIPVLFGDIGDEEIFELARVTRAHMVISTISNLTDNLTLLARIASVRTRPITVFTAHTRDEATKYYEKGATLAVVPQTVSGEYLRHILETYGLSRKKIETIGKSQFNRLISR